MVIGTVRWEARLKERWPKTLKTNLTQGGHQARFYSDQMVLVMTRQEAGPQGRQAERLKGELKNNSRKPRDLVRKLA
jgi:hypothetical protein